MAIGQRIENVFRFAPPRDQPRAVQQFEPRRDAAELVLCALDQFGYAHFARRQTEQQAQAQRICQRLAHERCSLKLARRIAGRRADALWIVDTGQGMRATAHFRSMVLWNVVLTFRPSQVVDVQVRAIAEVPVIASNGLATGRLAAEPLLRDCVQHTELIRSARADTEQPNDQRAAPCTTLTGHQRQRGSEQGLQTNPRKPPSTKAPNKVDEFKRELADCAEVRGSLTPTGAAVCCGPRASRPGLQHRLQPLVPGVAR